MLEIAKLRHSREKIYLWICIALGALIWAALLYFSRGTVLIVGLVLALLVWISEQFFKSILFGNAILVGEKQYTKIHEVVRAKSAELGLDSIPEVFIINSQGLTNALAIRFLSKKYVILFSELIDLMLNRKAEKELTAIIAHELAHHAAGHTNFWLNLLIAPAMFIPFLGSAYGRAREFTADRIALAATADADATMRALVSLVVGSEALASSVDLTVFTAQENRIPWFFGWWHEIFATHPRMTRRIIALAHFASSKEE